MFDASHFVGKLKLPSTQTLLEASSNFARAGKPDEIQQCLGVARLVGLQIQMQDKMLFFLRMGRSEGTYVLDTSSPLLQAFLDVHPDFLESHIVGVTYGKLTPEDWSGPVFQQVCTS